MTAAAFVVTGCGRSGTGYAAALLTSAGRPCGHERLFTPATTAVPTSFVPSTGDASWLAAPFVGDLPGGSVVVHLVRHPLDVVRSHVGIGFFSLRAQSPVVRLHNAVELTRRAVGARRRRYVRSEFLRFVERHDPEILRAQSEVARCVAYWIRWNLAVEHAAAAARLPYARVQVERIDAAVLHDLLSRLGSPTRPEQVEGAVATVPRDVNARDRDERVGWRDLVAADPDRRLTMLAERYGFEPP